MVEKHRICCRCVRTLSKSLDKGILISLGWGVCRFWTVWTGRLCECADLTCSVLVIVFASFSSHHRLLPQCYNHLLCCNTTPAFSQLEQVKTGVPDVALVCKGLKVLGQWVNICNFASVHRPSGFEMNHNVIIDYQLQLKRFNDSFVFRMFRMYSCFYT